jgi:Zn finger protein HypA/HybF involved in hydrogenase expression
MTLPDRVLSGLLLLFVAPAFVWAQAGQESSTICAKCHAEGRTQPATHMAHALETIEQARILIDHPLLTATYGRYSYRIERKGDQSLYSVTDGTATITMPIRWAMGASSALGQTYILEKDGKYYESSMSWFRELNALGPTLGGQSTHPADLNEAAGRLLSQEESLRCFGCHATDAVSGKQLTLDKMRPGVQCSHCHQATEAHVAAMARGSGKPAVPAGLADLHDLTAEQTSNFCGRCHRTWVEIMMGEDHSINNIRFQPYRLWSSLCYDPDDARISCLACHDPHTEPSAQPADYDAKCQACHGGGKVEAKACPVSKNNCVSCHMPKIELPGAHFKFTDHRIRIVKPNERYPGE